MRLIIYSDGGSRGNPGPAAGAFLILDEKQNILQSGSRYLGRRTNNQAEYEALIDALDAAVSMHAPEAICHLDSELVCRHLTGEYRVKNPELRLLWNKIQEIMRCFRKVCFVSVPRNNKFIQEVDRLVNEQLDSQKQHG